MSAVYNVPIPFTAVTAAVDIVELNGHAARPFVILEVNLYQITEVGDAQEEQLQLALKTGATTSGSGGNASANGVATDGGGASGFGFETFNTTKASGGTIVSRKPMGWNVRGPFEKIFTDLAQDVYAAAARVTLELVNAPADSITIGGYLVVQEIGS